LKVLDDIAPQFLRLLLFQSYFSIRKIKIMDVSKPIDEGTDWRNRVEDEEDSESGQLIEKSDLERTRIQGTTKHRVHWSIWIITLFNTAVFAATVALALRLKANTCSELEAIKKTHSYCKLPFSNQPHF
jgi:hypothetical protein